MSENIRPIFKRRSVRSYAARSIADDQVQDLLAAAMAAPSACATDPWEFIVVRDRQTLTAIAAALPNGRFLSGAGLGLVVCGNMQRAHDGHLSYMLQDCSAAIENVLITATLLGLGGCWLGVHPRPDRVAFLRDFFKLPSEIIPLAVLSLGWPAAGAVPGARTRYNSEYVHHEKW